MGLRRLMLSARPDEEPADLPAPDVVATVVTAPAPPVANDDEIYSLIGGALVAAIGGEVVRALAIAPQTPEQAAAEERRWKAETAAAAVVVKARAERQEAFDDAVAAGPPRGPRPSDGRSRSQRVADASRMCHAAWTDYLVTTQPLDAQDDIERVMVERVMPYEETSRLMHANGWSHYPQARDADRKPNGFGRATKMKTILDRDGSYRTVPAWDPKSRRYLTRPVGCFPKRYRETAPGPGLHADWIAVTPYETNVAIQCCAASGHAWVVDVDVEDGPAAAAIRDLCVEHLGPTVYDRYRVDSAKFAVMYRHAADDVDAFRSEVIRLGDLGAVECQGPGKAMTWHGRHWQTGAVFRSHGPLPGMDEGATPDLAPIVTVEQLRALKAAIRETFGVAEPVRVARSSSSPSVVPGEVGGVRVNRLSKADYVGAHHRPDGLVHDQRDEWLWAHARALARINADLDEATFVDLLREDALGNLAVGGKWTEEVVATKCVEKGARALANHRDWVASLPQRQHRPTVVVEGRTLAPVEHACAVPVGAVMRAVIPSRADAAAARAMSVIRTEADPAAAVERALVEDRAAIQERVGTDIRSALTDWVRCLYDVAMGERRVDLHELQARAQTVMLVRGPTGSGKTRTFLDVCRVEKERARAAGFTGRVTILMMLPSYALLEEVYDRLVPGGDDAAAVPDGERARMDEVEAAGRAVGLDVMQYRGKRFTCGRLDAWQILTDAGVGTAGMCKSTSREKPRDANGFSIDGAKDVSVETICKVWENGLCEWQNQRVRIAQSDLVLLPTAYVTLPIPGELKAATALVIDESVVDHFARTSVLDPAWLSLPRREPRLSKKRRAAAEALYPDRKTRDAHQAAVDVMLLDRAEAARIATDCIARGVDVAAHLADHSTTYPNADPTRDAHVVTGLHLAQAALSVSGLAADVHEQVTSDIDVGRAADVARNPRATGLLQEIRFWRLVVERIGMILADRVAVAEFADRRANCVRLKLPDSWYDRPENQPVLTVRGDRDQRLRVTTETVGTETRRMVRMSWRPANRFAELPTMLLDASADEAMIGKIWPDRHLDVRCTDAVPLHLQTVWLCDEAVSLRSRLPYKHKDIEGQAGAAQSLDDTRGTIAGLAGAFAHSRLLVSTPKQLEVALNTSWEPPANVDFVHDGAVVGLNFAADHAAVLIVSQTDLPLRAIEDKVACWSYDDPEPEPPIDVLGTGLDAEGDEVRCPLGDVTVPMRDGSEVVAEMRVYQGAWARRVQLQSREEPMRQSIGRVRPVYKDGKAQAPLVFVMSRVMPLGIVVDELAVGAQLRKRLAHYVEAQAVGCLPLRDGGAAVGTPRTPTWDALLKAAPETATHPQDADHRLGLSRYTYDRGDGRRLTVDVLAHEDPLAAIARFEGASSHSVFDAGTADVEPDASNRPLRAAKARPVDTKMEALLGPMSARAEAAAAALAEVERRDAAKAWPDVVHRMGLTAGAKTALLTVRPRTPADAANRIETLFNVAATLVAEQPAPVVTPTGPEPEVAYVPPGRTGNDDDWDLSILFTSPYRAAG